MINCRWVIVGLLAAAGCSREPDARTYQLTGQVLAVKAETNEILVKHDDIPGFMPAMTMPYTVRDPALIKDRVPGDLIEATLVVEVNAAYLRNISKIGSAPIPDDVRTTIPAAAGIDLLRPGHAVPDTARVNQADTAIPLRACT